MISMLVLALVTAAPTPSRPAQIDGAGNRIETFAPIAGGKDSTDSISAVHCTPDRQRCAQLSLDVDGNVWTLYLFDRLPGAAGKTPIASFPVPNEDGNARMALWPRIVREASGRVLVGVEATSSTSYSGGGASAATLTLAAAETGNEAMKAVLTVPSRGSAMIRACFSEADMQQRASACHDEYAFDGTLTLDPAVRTGAPHFIFTTSAKSFPGPVSRSADSLAAAPLRRKDVKWVTDAQCSYRRTISPDAASGTFRIDTPLPVCDDYLVP